MWNVLYAVKLEAKYQTRPRAYRGWSRSGWAEYMRANGYLAVWYQGN